MEYTDKPHWDSICLREEIFPLCVSNHVAMNSYKYFIYRGIT